MADASAWAIWMERKYECSNEPMIMWILASPQSISIGNNGINWIEFVKCADTVEIDRFRRVHRLPATHSVYISLIECDSLVLSSLWSVVSVEWRTPALVNLLLCFIITHWFGCADYCISRRHMRIRPVWRVARLFCYFIGRAARKHETCYFRLSYMHNAHVRSAFMFRIRDRWMG